MTEPTPPTDPIQFKPINEGLGFHPFSTGLPYASPPQKTVPKTPAHKDLPPPSGAVSAGAPRFAKTVPATRMAAPRTEEPKVAVAPAVQAEPLDLAEEDFGFAYLVKRLIAFGFDFTFNLCMSVGVIFLSLWSGGAGNSPVTDDMIVVGLLFFLVLNWIIMTLEEMIFKTTLGKRILGLRFEGAGAGTLLLRAVAFPVGVFFFGIGIFWAIFDSHKRCWHDLAARTQPVEIPKS